jgi:hypothetical protein
VHRERPAPPTPAPTTPPTPRPPQPAAPAVSPTSRPPPRHPAAGGQPLHGQRPARTSSMQGTQAGGGLRWQAAGCRRGMWRRAREHGGDAGAVVQARLTKSVLTGCWWCLPAVMHACMQDAMHAGRHDVRTCVLALVWHGAGMDGHGAHGGADMGLASRHMPISAEAELGWGDAHFHSLRPTLLRSSMNWSTASQISSASLSSWSYTPPAKAPAQRITWSTTT